MMPRIRFKAFGSHHTNFLEQDVNKWLLTLEKHGLYPEIFLKESRVTTNLRDGKPFVLVTYFYRLKKMDDADPLLEVDVDSMEGR